MFESTFVSLDQLVGSVRAEWSAFDGSVEDFLGRLVEGFVCAAEGEPRGAGAVSMALSLWLLVRQQELVERLVEDVRLRDDALRLLFELDSL